MTRFTSQDANRAHETWGCNCGPGVLAAIMDMTLDEVHPHLRGFDEKGYTDPNMMNDALRSIGRTWRKIGRGWPNWGLVRVQWEGLWTQPGVPVRARYRYTHWIGCQTVAHGIGIFDINCMNNGTGWVSLANWEMHTVPFLTGLYPRASGKWHITHAIEVSR